MPQPPKIFHLRLFGQPHVVSVHLPDGDAETQVLAATRKLSDVVVSEAIRQTRDQGTPITCGPGCGACCRQLVRINVLEAMALAKLVADMPPQRQTAIRARFAAAMEKLRAAGLVAPAAPGQRPRLSINPADLTQEEWMKFAHNYFDLGIACPFLEEESCGIYDQRPLICREYMVTSSVRHCQTLDVPQTKTVPLIQISERLIEMVSANDESTPPTTTLIFALEWAAASANGDLPAPQIGDAESALLMLSLFCRAE